jgi:DNA-directed RNA polymerase specialized sigma24 family protein
MTRGRTAADPIEAVGRRGASSDRGAYVSRDDAGTGGGTDITNREFELLVERSVLLRDVTATQELKGYLLSKIYRKARAFSRTYGDAEYDDLVADLLNTGFQVARRTLEKPVAKPRNYVVRALTNRYVDLLRRQKQRAAAEVLTDFAVEGSQDDDGSVDDVNNSIALEQFWRAQPEGNRRKAAQVIRLAHWLRISEREACELMEFGPTERETVLRTVRRWRTDPHSPLHETFGDGWEGDQ